MAAPFVHELRVRYAECDLQGVVFNPHYLAYFDTSMTELWRAALGGYQAMLAKGVDMVLAEAQVRFLAPARFDDRLKLSVAVTHLGNTSFVTEHAILRDGIPVAQGKLRHVLVDRESLRKASIPAWLREGLEPWHVPERAR
jgi:acyl-CoA thioester hydrolase